MRTPDITSFPREAIASIEKHRFAGGKEITIAKGTNEVIYVLFADLCESLELNLSTQLRKYRSYNRGRVVIMTYGAPAREFAWLKLETVAKWLADLNPNKVREELRPFIEKWSIDAEQILHKVKNLGHTVVAPTSVVPTVVASGVPAEFANDSVLAIASMVTSIRVDQLKFEKRFNQFENAVGDELSTVHKNVSKAMIESSEAKAMANTILTGKLNDVPHGFIRLEEIRKNYFYGVSTTKISEFLRSVGHPTQMMLGGDDLSKVNPVPVFKDEKLAEQYKLMIEEASFVNETEGGFRMNHPKLQENFILKKREAPIKIQAIIRGKML